MLIVKTEKDSITSSEKIRPQAPPQLRPQPTFLVEGKDYYVENGRWVFTAQYLSSRGYCCGSGCRHCPYRNTTTSP